MNGILALWKPKGMTSHDCVFKARKILQTKKIGHTGTLDPDVEGVLPLCIGQATKIVPYLTDTSKTYVAEVSLGTATETEDKSGAVIEEKPVTEPIPLQAIESVLQQFTGEIEQVPPMYSAIKVAGRKLYEYARKGQEVERPIRKVTIHEIVLDKASVSENGSVFRFTVSCSKGTYVRTLCVDIGKALGYPAHMSSLERIQAGAFRTQDTVTFAKMEEAMEAGSMEQLLQPITKAVDFMPLIEADAVIEQKVRYGQRLKRPAEADLYRVQKGDQLLGIYETHPAYPHLLKPKRVFVSGKAGGTDAND
ncbi:tRNA pseudouridine55 synthase [Terribacillus halophilus]|uniref:tRNA pseudouridine synthase B n=1 Tax=Terribacillus halophilus TaxID=361279 RepID=A0A1G6N3U2_9BACI|nr:tRNA pseudouridine(55) synthase TruB [Terribacillus halophilus]SDC61795.1 tRNA pseudouridine55 synthase [Terribacillus halophilus]